MNREQDCEILSEYFSNCVVPALPTKILIFEIKKALAKVDITGKGELIFLIVPFNADNTSVWR